MLLYLTLMCKKTLRLPFQCFWVASYTFAAAFLTESYISCLGLSSKQADVSYEAYDEDGVLSSLAFRGWIVSLCSWMLPMPLVHVPFSLFLSFLYQSKTFFSSFSHPPVKSDAPAWFAHPPPAELKSLLDEYFDVWGATGSAGRFKNASPNHFSMFVLQRMRAKGHGSLSYLTTRRIEAIFEEKVEEVLEEDKGK